MKILCFGSLNLDHTYQVEHMVRPSETILAGSLETYCGGKGLNQAVAAAKAGSPVTMAGCIGPDGQLLKTLLSAFGVDTSLIKTLPNVCTGHAIIQTDPAGENCILVYGGANVCIPEDYIHQVLETCQAGDVLILQNEINHLDLLISLAHEKGMQIFFTPAPMKESIKDLPLDQLTMLLCNRIEACELAGVDPQKHQDPESLIRQLLEQYSLQQVIMTLGSKGSMYINHDEKIPHYQQAYSVHPVDTTAAGDAYAGFLISGLCRNLNISEAMALASAAAALSTTKPGAAVSIPDAQETQAFLGRNG